MIFSFFETGRCLKPLVLAWKEKRKLAWGAEEKGEAMEN